jgi:hypothetical protein
MRLTRQGPQLNNISRIKSLEHQVTAIQSTLVDLVSTLRAGMSSGTSNGSGNTPAAPGSTPDRPHTGFMQSGSIYGMNATGIPKYTSPSGIGLSEHLRNDNIPSNPTQPFWNESVRSQSQAPTSIPNFGYPPRQDIMPPPQPGAMLAGHNPMNLFSGQPSPLNTIPESLRMTGTSGLVSASSSNRASMSQPWPESTPGISHDGRHPESSLPMSRVGSMGAEDLLGPEDIINPLGAMSNMAGLVEAAVERAREEQVRSTNTIGASSSKRATSDVPPGNAPDEGDESRTSKKARFSPTEKPHGPVIMESQNLPPMSTAIKGRPKAKKAHIHAYPDAVAEGFLTEDEGKELMQM